MALRATQPNGAARRAEFTDPFGTSRRPNAKSIMLLEEGPLGGSDRSRSAKLVQRDVDLSCCPRVALVCELLAALFDEQQIAAVATGPVLEDKADLVQALVCPAVIDSQA